MSEKAIRELQERVAHLEEEVRLLRAQSSGNGEPWWKQISGTLPEDPEFLEILRRQREEDYRQANEEIDRLEAAERKEATRKKTAVKATGTRNPRKGRK